MFCICAPLNGRGTSSPSGVGGVPGVNQVRAGHDWSVVSVAFQAEEAAWHSHRAGEHNSPFKVASPDQAYAGRPWRANDRFVGCACPPGGWAARGKWRGVPDMPLSLQGGAETVLATWVLLRRDSVRRAGAVRRGALLLPGRRRRRGVVSIDPPLFTPGHLTSDRALCHQIQATGSP